MGMMEVWAVGTTARVRERDGFKAAGWPEETMGMRNSFALIFVLTCLLGSSLGALIEEPVSIETPPIQPSFHQEELQLLEDPIDPALKHILKQTPTDSLLQNMLQCWVNRILQQL